jgi:hypothetical protein
VLTWSTFGFHGIITTMSAQMSGLRRLLQLFFAFGRFIQRRGVHPSVERRVISDIAASVFGDALEEQGDNSQGDLAGTRRGAQ